MTRIEPGTHAHPTVTEPKLPSEKPVKKTKPALIKTKASLSIPPLEPLNSPSSHNLYQKKYQSLTLPPKISSQNKKV